MKNPRDIRIWAIIVSLSSLFIFAILSAYISRAYPEEIEFFGTPMNFHYFIFGLFVFVFILISGFFIRQIRKAKVQMRGSQKR